MKDQQEIRTCEYCGVAFHPARELQRFHSLDCNRQFYMRERREALAAWRLQQRAAAFFGSTVQPVADEMDEHNTIRRRA